MKFSLIMATFGRKNEIYTFINSLLIQTYKHFELIIIDQNHDDIVYQIYEEYKHIIEIKYIKSEKKGLSYNRNIGLEQCLGDIIAFPDDDCEYVDNTLEKAVCFFEKNEMFNFYTCNVKDKYGNSSILTGDSYDTEVTLDNFMRTSISFTIFARALSMQNFKFDTQLGLGARYGSGEESDLMLFLIKNKNKGFYHANTYIYHPNSQRSMESLISYGKGFGAFHKKAIVYYRYYFFLPRFFLTLLKESIKICLFFPQKKERIAVMKGRICGFIGYSVPKN